MAVRPPQDDSADPDQLAFGIAALDARLDEATVEFPATTREIVDAVDNTDVPYDTAGHTLALDEALSRIPKDRFESEQELLDVLHPVFEDERARSADSILAQIRRLLPF